MKSVGTNIHIRSHFLKCYVDKDLNRSWKNVSQTNSQL